MTLEIWVQWTGGARATIVQVEDPKNPKRPANVDDLCKVFAKQEDIQRPSVLQLLTKNWNRPRNW